jgi:hypothetical protein
VTDSPLDEAAPIEHLVTKRVGFLRRISSLIRPVILEHPVDIGAQRRKFLSFEDALENDIAL